MLGRSCVAGMFMIAFVASALAADPIAPPELESIRLAAEPADEQRVWFEQTGPDTGSTVYINVRVSGEQDALQPVVFQVELRATNTLSTAFLELVITDAGGVTLHHDRAQVYIPEEFTPYKLAWDASAVPPGAYKATFSVSKLPALPVSERVYVVKKMTRSQLLALAGDAQAKVAGAVAAVRELQAADKKPPYIIARAAIAEDCAAYVRRTLAENPWRTSERLIRYLASTAEALRAQIAFMNELPEFSQPIPEPDLGALAFRDGVVYAGPRPAFLFGKNFGDERPSDELARIRSYGLNIATIQLAPRDTLAGEAAEANFREQLDPVLKKAADENIGLLVSLAPHDLPDWALAQWPELRDPVLDRVNIAQPKARELVERHFRAAIPYLAESKAVTALSIITAPQFRFLGEEVRQGFIARVKEIYGDRNTLNQEWRSLFSAFDEIATAWDRGDPRFLRSERYLDKSAYQYDWQTYHQRLGTQYLQGIMGFARSLAGDEPLFVAFGGDILEAGESQFGLDREAAASLFDLVGCCAANTVTDPHYALGYPQQPLLYNLLKSLAPGRPLVNSCDGVIPPYDPEAPCTFDYVHTAMWEAAMAGLNASALTADDWLTVPECLDGYVTACLDLNRLAEVVYAFQTAPAHVGILWSMSSKIYNEGDPFLESVKFAYEGSSFAGYKVRFISEEQILAGGLADISVLVLPETPSIKDETFALLKDYINSDGALIRTSAPILFNEHGGSRRDVITTTPRTVLLRGQNLPTEYLHSMDAVISFGVLPMVPRAINAHGYPLEGVRTRYVEHGGAAWLYAVNLRKENIECHLAGGQLAGRDVVNGRDVTFPTVLEPLKPMLLRLNEIPVVAPPTALITPPEVPPQT